MLHDTYGNVSKFITDRPENQQRCHLIGRAGTGKSTAAMALKKYDEELGRRTIMCAFTNEIADQLPSGVTIHKALNLGIGSNNKPIFKSAYNPLYKVDTLYIDEYTLISKPLFKCINERLKGTKCKLVLIGDPYQVPSVGTMNNIVLTSDDTFELTTQYRNPEMETLINWFVWHIQNNQEVNVEELKEICRVGYIKDFINKDGENFQYPIILAYNNKVLRDIDNQFSKLPKDYWRLCTKYDPYSTGDLIPRDEYQGPAAWVIPEVGLTVHKSQGKTYKGSPLVMVNNILKAPAHIRTRLLYVACTRGTELPTLCIDPYTPSKRNSNNWS